MLNKKGLLAAILLLAMMLNLCACKPGSQSEDFSFQVEDVRTPEYEEYTGSDEEEEDNHIMNASVVGSWTRDIADDQSYGLKKSYDMRETTKWNPQANPGYVGNPGVVYLLDGYYDVNSWTMQFMGNPYYFDFLVSENGKDYTLLAEVTADNAAQYYNDSHLCTLSNLEAKHIAFVRIEFKGAGKNNPFVNLHEVSFAGTYTGLGPVSIPEEHDSNALPESLIASHTLIGSWKKDLATDTGYGPNKSYDSNPYSKWNPMAAVGYAGSPGIVYALKSATDIGKLQIMMTGGVHYFDVYATKDGQSYSLVATINKNNAGMGYKKGENDTYICTLDGLQLSGVTHIKMIFTGRTNASQYVNLTEVIVSEEGTEGVDTSWMKISKLSTDIVAHQILGEWVRNLESDQQYGPASSYDGISTTKWNPQTKLGYEGDPGIIYKLYRATKVMKITFEVSGTPHYFDVYVSTDGTEYTQIASISKLNEEQAFQQKNGNYVCTLDGLNLTGIQYIKVMLTGRSNGSTYVNFHEVTVHRSGNADADTSWMLPDPDAEDLMILSHQVFGEWVRNIANDPSYGVAKSYDGDPATKWNPQTKAGFAGEPGVVYQLSRPANLKKIVLTVSGTTHYFDVYSSTDGVEYTKFASISGVNEEQAYTEDGSYYICTLDGLTLTDIQYIKIVFTGRSNNGTFLNIHEVVFSEEGTDGLDTSWMLPEDEEPDATEPEVTEPNVTEPTEPDIESEGKATVTAGELVGPWKIPSAIANAFDGNTGTQWNPQSIGYESGESVVFHLDKVYDLSKIVFTYGMKYHYFKVLVSSDHETYTEIAAVTSDSQYTSQYVCTVDGLTAENVKYVKILFTGTSSGSAFVNLYEIEIYSKSDVAEPEATEPEMTEPETTEPEATEPVAEVKAVISAGELVGPWKIPSAIANAFDGNTGTQWNPQSIGYESGESVIFHLDKGYDLSKIVLTYSMKYHYFKVLVSSDHETYTEIAAITADNYTEYYSGYVCTIDGLSAHNVKYVKILFTGTSSGSAFVNLYEAELYGLIPEKEE